MCAFPSAMRALCAVAEMRFRFFSDELKLIISLVEGMRMPTYVTLHYRYCWIYGSELFTLEVVRSISIRLPEIESWRNKIMLQNTSRHQREVDEVIQNDR